MSQFVTSGDQSIETSTAASALPVNIPSIRKYSEYLGLTDLISLLSKNIEFSQPKSSASSHPQSKSSSISLEVPKLSSLKLLGAAHHPTSRSTPEIPPLSTSLAPPSLPCLVPHPPGTRNPRRVFVFLPHGDFALPGKPSPLTTWKLGSHPKCSSTVTPPFVFTRKLKGLPLGLSACYTHLFLRASSP